MVQLTDKHWAVEVPDDACRFEIRYGRLYGLKHPGFSTRSVLCVLEKGSWQYLFTTKGATEEDVAKILKKEGELYLNYELFRGHLQNYFETWQEALGSLLRSKGLNPANNHAIIKNIPNESE